MIMQCLTRAMEASAIAFAIFAITGCSGRSAAANAEAAARSGASPSVTASDTRAQQEDDEAPVVEAQAHRVMQHTLVEQYHFNAYRKFNAMLDAAPHRHGETMRSEPDTSGGADFSACSSASLIRQD